MTLGRMTMHRRGNGRLVVVAMLTLVLAACSTARPSGSASPASPSPAFSRPPADLTATVVQYRRDAPRRIVQIKFSNASSEDFEITLLGAALPGYEVAPGGVRTNPLKAGRRVDLPVKLGAATCDSTPSETPSAMLQLVSDGGSATRIRVPITDDDGLIERVRQRDCNVQRVEAAVDVELSDSWEQTGTGEDAAVLGHVTVALRPGTDSVRITRALAGELLGVEVLTPDGDRALPFELNAPQARADLDLQVIGTRCDGHAVAEAKRLIAFSFWVSVDGEPEAVLRLEPDVDGLHTLVAALLERCGTLH
jgi:hypothetical protein